MRSIEALCEVTRNAMTNHLIFIYGSLRRGCVGAMSLRFPNSKFVAEAKVSGNLYDLGEYPGLLINESGSFVVGEVYEVDDELLAQLDDFEVSSNYVRKQVEVSSGNHRMSCWVYEPEPACYSLTKLITSGNWVEYSRAKTD